ncbi:MAG: hypothetical protein ACK4GD_01365 [Sphingomonadaceae bacterium]
MIRAGVPSWQVVLSDLALILFLTTLAALHAATPAAVGQATEAARSQELAVYREGAGGLALEQWLVQQPPDPRAQLTVLARFAPGDLAVISRRAQALANRAASAGKPPRVVIEPAVSSEVLVSLAYDAPLAISQAPSTRLRPSSLAR